MTANDPGFVDVRFASRDLGQPLNKGCQIRLDPFRRKLVGFFGRRLVLENADAGERAAPYVHNLINLEPWRASDDGDKTLIEQS